LDPSVSAHLFSAVENSRKRQFASTAEVCLGSSVAPGYLSDAMDR